MKPSPKKKNHLSEEARQAASERAKKLHAEGKFGGSKFGKLGGRPRKERASTKIAEEAQKEAKAITQVFRDAIRADQPMPIRLKGAEMWVKIEQDEARTQIQEEEADGRQHSREELIEILAEKLTRGPAAQILRRELGDPEVIQDAEVVDENSEAA